MGVCYTRAAYENMLPAHGEASALHDRVSGDPKLKVLGSRHFTSWLAEHNASLAFSTYQTGKLFLIGRSRNGVVSAFERGFDRCMGLCATDQTLYLSTLYQIWRF